MSEIQPAQFSQDNPESLAYRAGRFVGAKLNRSNGPAINPSEDYSSITPDQNGELLTEDAVTSNLEISEADEGQLSYPTVDGYKSVYDELSAQYDAEIAQLETELIDLQRKDERQQRLRLMARERTGGRQGIWATSDHSEKLDEQIAKKYGTTKDIYAEEERLKRTLNKRTFQKEYLKSGTILEFEEEIDPKLLRKYLADPNEDLGETFHLPYNPNPTKNPAEAEEQLRKLPFVRMAEARRTWVDDKTPSIKVVGNWEFPMDRIIGVETFEDWSGRANGDKSFGPVNLPDIEKSSRGAITDYAQSDISWLTSDSPHGNGIDMDIIRDAEGEYWGIVTGGGSHRTSAAKLRGERKIPVGTITIQPDELMRTLPYSVKERYGARE